MPEDDDEGEDCEDSNSKLLVFTHDNIAEMWNVDRVNSL